MGKENFIIRVVAIMMANEMKTQQMAKAHYSSKIIMQFYIKDLGKKDFIMDKELYIIQAIRNCLITFLI